MIVNPVSASRLSDVVLPAALAYCFMRLQRFEHGWFDWAMAGIWIALAVVELVFLCLETFERRPA